MRATDVIENFRNAVQHLNHEIEGLVKREQPVWGSLSWFAILDPANDFGVSCAHITGTLLVNTKGAPTKVPEGGKEIDVPVGLILLSAHGNVVDVSDAMSRVARLVSGMEKELKGQFSSHPTAGADLITTAGFQFDTTESGESVDPSSPSSFAN